jgi:hypothetical protein
MLSFVYICIAIGDPEGRVVIPLTGLTQTHCKKGIPVFYLLKTISLYTSKLQLIVLTDLISISYKHPKKLIIFVGDRVSSWVLPATMHRSPPK